MLENELESAKAQLDQLQELMALESELEEAMSKRDALQQELEAASGRPVLCISAAMGTNLDQLLAETWAERGV